MDPLRLSEGREWTIMEDGAQVTAGDEPPEHPNALLDKALEAPGMPVSGARAHRSLAGAGEVGE
jgi:hypothetical protein